MASQQKNGRSKTTSYARRVFERTREIARIQAGKASETPGNPESESVFEVDETQIEGNPQLEITGAIQCTGKPVEARDAQTSENSSASAQEGSVEGLWERISKMESEKRKYEEAQTEILSNIVLNVAKMQQQLEKRPELKNRNLELCAGAEKSANARQDDEISVNDLFSNDTSKKADDGFFREFDDLYAPVQKFGPKIDDKVAQLFDRAIDKSMSEEQCQELEEKYLVPENCPRLEVQVVNKEIWTALKDKREGDLAMQSVQKHMKLAMVPTLQALDILKNKGDFSEVSQKIKDSFKILANGLHHCNRKRKGLIKPAIPAKYRKVCDLDNPVTTNLFGDDLESKVDEIEKQEKRTNKLAGFKPTPFLFKRPAPRGRSAQWIPKQREAVKGQEYPYQQTKGRSFRGKSQTQSFRGKRPY